MYTWTEVYTEVNMFTLYPPNSLYPDGYPDGYPEENYFIFFIYIYLFTYLRNALHPVSTKWMGLTLALRSKRVLRSKLLLLKCKSLLLKTQMLSLVVGMCERLSERLEPKLTTTTSGQRLSDVYNDHVKVKISVAHLKLSLLNCSSRCLFVAFEAFL